FGTLRTTSGQSHVKVSATVGSTTGTIRFDGSDFQGRSSIDFHADPGGRIEFVSPPTLSNGIIGPFATFNESDWATIDATGAVAPFTSYKTTGPTTWTAADNVSISSDLT